MTPVEPSESDLVDVAEASELLGVEPDLIQVMVDEEMLDPVEGIEEVRFHRSDLIALRELGG